MTNTTNTQKNDKKDKPPQGKPQPVDKPKEIGGRDGLDPVRYGDWEVNGKCVDF
jgi:hypothetical protein